MTLDEMCEAYKNNYYDIDKLDDLLHSGNDFNSWLSNMKERSNKIHSFYAKNNEILDKIREYECIPFETEEDALHAYSAIKDIYNNSIDDPEFLVPAIRKLISYFEKKRNVPLLLDLYNMAFYEINEMEARRSGAKADLTYQLKTLELKRYYRTLEEDKRKIFFNVYYNLAVVCLNMKSVSPQESYFWYKEASEFLYSDVVRPIDKDNKEINDLFNKLQYDWISIIDYANDLSVEALSDLFKLVTDLYDYEIENGNVYTVDPYVYSAYLEMERLMSRKTLGAVIQEYMEYFRYNYKKLLVEDPKKAFHLLTISKSTAQRWLSKSQDTFFKKKVFDEINDSLVLNTLAFNGVIPDAYIHQLLAEWCMLSLKFLTKPSDKEKAIFELVIKNQIPTYLHSVMVMKLVELVFEVSYRKRPDLYQSLHMNYDDLLTYVKKAALFHDIGKIKITDIINRQSRKLSNVEFEGVMNHPGFGMSLIEEDIDFEPYRDIIRYHHKYYDGSMGYPFGDHNTKSKYRIIIDLVTICDCMDAATDDLGRNYKEAKTFDDFMLELKEGMGSRYNPDLVSIIIESKMLMDKLKAITIDNRAKYMYDAYLGSLSFTKENLFE